MGGSRWAMPDRSRYLKVSHVLCLLLPCRSGPTSTRVERVQELTGEIGDEPRPTARGTQVEKCS